MAEQESILPLRVAQFVPTISFGGEESRFIIRGANVWLRSKADSSVFAEAYKGSLDLNEDIPTKTLTGTIAWAPANPKQIVGTGTAFLTELKPGSFIVTDESPSNFFVIEETIDDTHALISRVLDGTVSGVSAEILPIIYPLGNKRATQIRGNTVKFPRGIYLGVGDGEFRLNGQPISDTLNLTKLPQYAMYDAAADDYTIVGFGITLPSASPLFSLADQAGGTKNMFTGTYGIRIRAKSDPAGDGLVTTIGGTGGYSQPSANIIVTIGTIGHKIRITFLDAMNVAEGQNAWDIEVTQYENATQAALNSTLGPWYYYETVTAPQLEVENSVLDGTVSGLHHDFEFADGELTADIDLLSFDNDPPFDSEYVDLITSDAGITPVFFSCQGKRTTARPEGTSPGATIAVGKPDNPEAIMRAADVATFEGDTILGVLNARGRWWLLCQASLQTAILTGISGAPITCRSFWDVGFRNPFNMTFFKDYAFGFSTSGLFRSIGVGDTSDDDLGFSNPVDDFVDDWICSHELTRYDPKNKAMCFFYSGRERQSGYWVTLVLPYLIPQGVFNPPILLSRPDSDFIVSGVANVGQKLYFLAGGRNSLGDIESKTYEFDAADGVEIDCYLAWTFSDLGQEDTPHAVKGVASAIGAFTDAKVEIHGITANGDFDLDALENGHGIAIQTIELDDKTTLGRTRMKRQTVPAFSKSTARFSFKSTDGSGRLDELNLIYSFSGSRR